MATVGTVKTRITDALNRTDLDSFVSTYLETSYEQLQGIRDFDCQKKTQRILASTVGYSITAETDVKTPRQLFRVGGTDLTVPLVPTSSDTSRLSTESFYSKRSFEDVLMQRAGLLAANSETDSMSKIYALENGVLELSPKNAILTDQFVFLYYAYLAVPADDATNWFFTHCADFLLFETLKHFVPFLQESDDRVPAWIQSREAALTRIIGLDVGLKYGGGPLVMRG